MPKHNDAPRLLIVEGATDKKLMHRLCKELGIGDLDVILPITPEELLTDEDIANGSSGNGKNGAIERLIDLITNLRDEDNALQHLAMVVDADQHQNGHGYQRTFDDISQKLRDQGYTQDEEASTKACGLIFSHSDGLASIGVWIMPNNQEDGALESWISACINNTELPLFNHATTVVNELSTSFNRTFTGNKKAKAEVATWLAWQKSPSIGLYAAVGLLDSQSSEYKNLVTWLNYVFPP